MLVKKQKNIFFIKLSPGSKSPKANEKMKKIKIENINAVNNLEIRLFFLNNFIIMTKRKRESTSLKRKFDSLSNKATKIAGSPFAFIFAALAVVIWAFTGPVFGYSDTWQLLINTSTTIITFLMVFLIQQSQNKDTVALHMKLDELIAANKYASNRLVNIESLDEEDLAKMKEFYVNLAKKMTNEQSMHTSESIDNVKEKVEDLEENKASKKSVKEIGEDVESIKKDLQ